MKKITLAEYLAKKKTLSPETPQLDEIQPFYYNVLKPTIDAEKLIDDCIIALEKDESLYALKLLKDYRINKLLNEKTHEIVKLANAYFLGYR